MRQEARRPLTSRMHRSVSYECAARRRHASKPGTADVTHLANLAVRHVVEPAVGPSALLPIHRAYAQALAAGRTSGPGSAPREVSSPKLAQTPLSPDAQPAGSPAKSTS